MKSSSLLLSLQKIGLTKREAAVYLAALSLGECGMTELAHKAGMLRTSAYVTLESLEEKGLIGTFKTARGTRLLAKDPKFLLGELEKNTEMLKQVLPDLASLQNNSAPKPTVTYYEGVDAYIRAVELCLKKSNTTIRHIGSIAEGHQTLGEDYDFKVFMPARIKKHIYLKALYTPDTRHAFGGRNDDGYLREIRFLPDSLPMKTLTLIFGSTVVISTTKKTLVTVVIESDEIAEAERTKFDLIWNATKKAAS